MRCFELQASECAHLWLFFISFFILFIPPYFSEIPFTTRKCEWERENSKKKEYAWTQCVHMVNAIAIQSELSLWVHFIYSAIVNIVIVNYFTFSQSFVWRSDIIFSFWLVCVADCLLASQFYTTTLDVWWIFYYCYFHFSILSFSISLHFPFFVRSIHQALTQTSVHSHLHTHTYTYVYAYTHTHTHSRGWRCRDWERIAWMPCISTPPSRSISDICAIFFLIYKKICIKFSCNRQENIAFRSWGSYSCHIHKIWTWQGNDADADVEKVTRWCV